MKLGNRRPNTAICFVDQSTEEVLLKVACDANAAPLVGYRLYDGFGKFVAESDGLQRFPDGLTVRSTTGETLLQTPPDPNAPIQYRLYNKEGALVTCSDGVRTQIFRLLRMESETLGAQGRNGAARAQSAGANGRKAPPATAS